MTAALVAGRRLAESEMLDTCKITRPGAATAIDSDGLPVDADPTPVYSGPCKVQTSAVEALAPQSGDHVYTTQRLEVHIPVKVLGVQVGDIIEITESATDPAQVGRRLRVSALFRKTFATAQRIPVEEVVA